MVAVYRGSTDTETIDATELVVGDLVHFESGMKCPADLIMVAGQDVACVEADLTGEPDQNVKKVVTELNKQDTATMLAKSLIVSGVGTGLVVAVGTNTAAGAISEET